MKPVLPISSKTSHLISYSRGPAILYEPYTGPTPSRKCLASGACSLVASAWTEPTPEPRVQPRNSAGSIRVQGRVPLPCPLDATPVGTP